MGKAKSFHHRSLLRVGGSCPWLRQEDTTWLTRTAETAARYCSTALDALGAPLSDERSPAIADVVPPPESLSGALLAAQRAVVLRTRGALASFQPERRPCVVRFRTDTLTFDAGILKDGERIRIVDNGNEFLINVAQNVRHEISARAAPNMIRFHSLTETDETKWYCHLLYITGKGWSNPEAAGWSSVHPRDWWTWIKRSVWLEVK